MAATFRESRAIWLLAVLGIIAALYFAKDIFIPLAVAILLTFVLAPLVRILQHRGLPRTAAAILVVIMAFAFIFSVAGLLAQQVTELAERLPQYETTITQKIHKLQETLFSGDTFQRLSRFLSRVDQEISQNPPPTAQQTSPTPVRIVEPSLRPTEVIQRIIRPLADPLTTVGLILLFVVFFLLEWETLRDRLIRLVGSHDLRHSTELINDAASRLSRYFLVQTGINVLFGVIVAVGLTLIGVPNPILWGILGMLLRFVPYLGAWIAAAFPIIVSFAVDPGWYKTLSTTALFLVTEPIIGQVIEPYLYGRSTGLTPVAVVISAAFWTWLWGPIGLLLSTPLAVCLGVLGRHFESLQFLEVMIGDEPPLTPAQTFYQRALAGRENEAIEPVEHCLKEEKDLTACFQHVVIDALILAEIDRRRDLLDAEHLERINRVIRSLLAEFADQDAAPPRSKEGADQSAQDHPVPAETEDRRVLCISGPGPFDETTSLMLAHLLGKAGIQSRLESDASVAPLNVVRLDTSGIAIVCLLYLDLGHSPAHLRYAIRRIRRRLPATPIVACLWGYEEGHAPPRSELAAAGADSCTTTIAETLQLCTSAVREEKPAAAEPKVKKIGAA
jgi:predicted PurR-regulated permease PerM